MDDSIPMKHAVLLATLLAACDGATASLQLANQTSSVRTSAVLADGTTLRLKLIAVYITEDVDPASMDNLGASEVIWINPQCGGDLAGCNVAGFAQPAGGPRITDYFDLSRPSAEVNAELDSQGLAVRPGTYRYARVELCKALDATAPAVPTVPTMMWRGPGMMTELPFTSGDCGRTSQAFDPPLVLAAGDAVAVTLGYDLDRAGVSGAPAPGNPGTVVGATELDGTPHQFRTCSDVDDMHRDCLDFPELAPSAVKL
ncbi:hypothetical protein BH11MYX1_BH11MYX1_17270 [soil metagenome]